jgi:hypothetical protein
MMLAKSLCPDVASESGLWAACEARCCTMGISILSLLGRKLIYFIIRFMNAYPRFSRLAIECAEHVAPPMDSRDVVCGENLLDWLFGELPAIISRYQALVLKIYSSWKKVFVNTLLFTGILRWML